MNMRTLLCIFMLFSSSMFFGCTHSTNNNNSTAPKIFHADFEEGSLDKGALDNWSYLLNPQGIEIISEDELKKESKLSVYAGRHAAKITIKNSDDFLWNGADYLNRSELQYAPASAVEGGKTRISFAFMLPTLFTNSRHDFAYWESNQSYQQIMRFNLIGKTMSFQMSNADVKLWSFDQLQPGTWYKVDMLVKWSSSEHGVDKTTQQGQQPGAIKVWLDNQLVVDEKNIKTLVANEQAFFQIGILRDKQTLDEVIYLDEVIEYSLVDKYIETSNL